MPCASSERLMYIQFTSCDQGDRHFSVLSNFAGSSCLLQISCHKLYYKTRRFLLFFRGTEIYQWHEMDHKSFHLSLKHFRVHNEISYAIVNINNLKFTIVSSLRFSLILPKEYYIVTDIYSKFLFNLKCYFCDFFEHLTINVPIL